MKKEDNIFDLDGLFDHHDNGLISDEFFIRIVKSWHGWMDAEMEDLEKLEELGIEL